MKFISRVNCKLNIICFIRVKKRVRRRCSFIGWVRSKVSCKGRIVRRVGLRCIEASIDIDEHEGKFLEL